MSTKKGEGSKAAWARAREYAAEHGVSLREARSALAGKAAPSKKAAKPASATKGSKPQRKKASDDLASAEATLKAKYPHVVPGTLKIHKEGPHKGRRTVEIQCQTPGCKNRRLVHTSDLFQVSRCITCAKTYRSKRRTKSTKKGKK